MPFRNALSLIVACVFIFPISVFAAPAGREIADAANNFLASLTPEQKAKATYEFKDEERFDWHFIPKPRKGLPFKEMTPPQRLLAHALLSSGLSQRGYAKATSIMSLEQILYEIENQAPRRDAEMYYVTVFGQPGKGPWGWRVEGHHVSLNFSLAGQEVLAVTPSFFGTNPAEIKSGPRKGLRVLGGEEDIARMLVTSLSDEQKKVALITNVAPGDIVTGHDRKARRLEPVGIAASALKPDQQAMLDVLLKEYVYRVRPEVADADWKAIQDAGRAKIQFAWAGGLEPGEGHYYRIQGPTFLMEYDCTQDKANHIHTVWRDLQNDFGDDLLAKHYQEAHSK